MATSSNPVTPRHMLGGELRTAREGTGLTREQAAKTIGFSLSKLLRIEGGEQGVSPVDLRALLELYGVTDEERVTELGRLAREQPAQVVVEQVPGLHQPAVRSASRP